MKKTKLRKVSKRPTKALKDRAWKAFSLWIRERDDWKCITCGKVEQSGQMHAGHFRHRVNITYFNETNVNAQCSGCNTFKHGELGVYAIQLDKKYGKGTAEKLTKLSYQLRQAFTKQELEAIIEKYK